MKFKDFVYKRPDMEKLEKEYRQTLKEFDEADSFEKQNEGMKKINKLASHYSTMSTIASIRNSLNSNDEFYDKEKDFFDKVSPTFQGLNVEYYNSLVNSKFRKDLEKKWGKRIFDIAELEMKTYSDEVKPLLQKENGLVSQYNKLTSNAKIQFEGEERNLAGMTPFMQDTRRNIRKEAYIAVWDFFEKNSNELDRIYDELVKIRTEIAIKLGYKNFVQLAYDRMGRSDYNADMVAQYRKQIHETIVPMAVKLRKRQAKRIKLDKMKVYDEPLKFLSGNPTPKGDENFMIENARNMYAEMSQETKEFFDFMIENELMDLTTRSGKRPGGYCTFLDEYKAPFIFSNFNGTSHDVDVLTHEAGHAFQMFRSKDFEIPEYKFPTLEACEIHSMSMEFFAWPWIDNFFKEDTDKYKFSHLADSILFLPYGVAVDEFQHFVYENPTATPEERKDKWIEIENKYMPDIDNEEISYLKKGGRWQKQLHIYCVPFYYIDYTLAQVCALQYWQKDQKNHFEAWKSYISLCNMGGSKSFVELCKESGLTVPFERGCIDSIAGDIEKWLQEVDDSEL
ncbi:MAG: M3 family oligoendopeptidase [Candidatus Muiribacteriota bacterium]